MKLAFKKVHLAHLKQQQQLLLGVCAVLTLANAGLIFGLLNQDERWVLIPQLNADHRVELSRDSYSQAYLYEWAGDILRDVFTANPASIDRKVKRLLEISRSSYTQLRDKLRDQAKILKDNGASTVFYPKDYRVNKTKQQIVVGGDYLTFFGKDKKPVVQTKSFVVGYERGPHGVILLTSLEEQANA